MAMAAEKFLLPVNMMAMAVFMSACSVAAVLRRQPRESSRAISLYGRCWREAAVRRPLDLRGSSRSPAKVTAPAIIAFGLRFWVLWMVLR
jgi:hypothetical protein